MTNLALTANLLTWIRRVGPDLFDLDSEAEVAHETLDMLSVDDAVEISTLVRLALSRGIDVHGLVRAVKRAARDAN